MSKLTPDSSHESFDSSYQNALEWLYRFTDTEKQLDSPIDVNLPGTQALLELLDNPHTRYPTIVIAGTNGKGSTAVMLDAILQAAGLRSGLYTTPHLHSFHERIQINRKLVSKAQIVALVAQLQPAVACVPTHLQHLSFYEVTTPMALLHFANQAVDVAVLEIGLGGRLDAVNLVTPVVSVITSISFDHMHILGNSLRDIAEQKAGIIKTGVPVIVAPQHPEVAEVLQQTADLINAPLLRASVKGIDDRYMGIQRPYPIPITPQTVALAGSFQLENARIAISTALHLRKLGISIDDTALVHGLARVRWPARLERLQEQPLVLADGAHNADAAQKLITNIHHLFRFQRLLIILGVLGDKDITAMAQALVPSADVLFLVQVAHPRATSIDRLAMVVSPYVYGPLHMSRDVATALDTALHIATPDDLICITGSLIVAAAARQFYKMDDSSVS